MTVTEVTGLVNLFNGMLLSMEGRLIDKMDDNSRLAAERWAKHDAELSANTKRVVERFEKTEAAILVLEESLSVHLRREHDEDIANEARVKPVKTVVGFLWAHWRDLVLLFIGLFALMTFLVDAFGHVLGIGPP
jgi:hypothetical protein